MTFVNRSPKWVIPPLEATPGPGAYTSNHAKQQPAATSCFLSKTVRDQSLYNENELGPGSYNLAKDFSKQSQSQAVFKSKIQRFMAKKAEQSAGRSQIEQKFEELSKFTQQHKPTPGKLITFNERRQFQKKLMPQNLPSIPTQDSSFGYHFDQVTKKLVHNQNPKIIFAKVLSSSTQDFFFQRAQSYIGKGAHFSIEKKVKRSSPELKYQIGLPGPTQYQPLETSLGRNNKVMNVFVLNQERFEEPASPKDLLKLQRLKREFKSYIPKDVDLKDLQVAKPQLQNYGSQTAIRKVKNAQCFLSKLDRFKQRKTTKQGEHQKLQLKISDKPAQNQKKVNDSGKGKSKKQPYGLGEARFKSKGKQNLGPGCYEIKGDEPNAANLNQKEQRFKTQNLADMPGPGTYQIQPSKSKQRLRVPFTRYVCQRDKNRFSSMESLYQEVGKQLNYESKGQRQVVRRSPERQVKVYEVYRRHLNRVRELVKCD